MPELRDMPPLETFDNNDDDLIDRDGRIPIIRRKPISPKKLAKLKKERIMAEQYFTDDEMPYNCPTFKSCFNTLYACYKHLSDNWEDFSNDILEHHLIC